MDCITHTCWGNPDAGKPASSTGTPTNPSCSKAMRIFCALFWISAVAITVTLLIVTYPTTVTISYSVFGALAGVSFMAIAGLLLQNYLAKSEPPKMQITAQASSNPFEAPK